MDVLTFVDSSLFLAINHLPHTFFLDTIARGFSGIGEWGAIWLLVAVFLFYREEVKHHLFFIPFIYAAVLSFLSEFILKWVIARPRPYVEMGAIILDSPGSYSFPSTHATIAFAYAYICSRIDPKLRVTVYILAFCISLSRIYLGAHYPFDIMGGAILGSVIGILAPYHTRARHKSKSGSGKIRI